MAILKKLNNFGKKEKLTTIDLNKIRNSILLEAKKQVVFYGWNENIFDNIANNSKFNIEEIITLFPNGYIALIEMYIDTINDKMIKQSKKIDFYRLKTHERIKKLLILRLKIMAEEKKIISKTYFHLLLPQNYRVSYKSLYKTVDLIWYIAGDNSTDFNFYTKRAILASIYSSVILHFVNNNNLDKTIDLLNLQLKRVSKIPIIKSKVKDVIQNTPNMFNLFKSILSFKQ